MTLFIDIETRATENKVIIERLQAEVKCPGNYTKAETIAEWYATKGIKAKQEAVAKTALDGTWGRLASVAWAEDDEPIKCMSGDDEVGMLHGVREIMSGPRVNLLVAHNGEFDFRFLHHRFVICDVTKPYLPLDSRKFFDTMREWAGFRDYISQADLEMALGIERDDPITGADVGDYIAMGDWATVEQHNIEDVRCLREIFKRMTK